ncbi:MAG: U32 family peptidase [Smithellaceae bacterium]|nr:U32 family peptidase [Smithellaceae bacterium]
MRRPELLLPAGNLEKLRTAVLYGADAVYAGVAGLSLRAASAEMSPDDLAAGIAHAHAAGVRVYAASNTFARDGDLETFRRILPEVVAAGADALIVSDPGLIRLLRKLAPQIPLHLSTQANTTNAEAVRFWRDQGVERIILARELNLADVEKIVAAVPDMELEIFIHGAMCMAYSGRCYLSAWRNRRSANAGDCTQPCRWEYLLRESTRPDDPLILAEDERYSYFLSSKDLCLLPHLPDVLKTGVAGLKVEGRMKSSYYTAVVARVYRQALDALLSEGTGYVCRAEWMDELQKVSHRGYTTGFAFAQEKINETSPGIKNIQTHEPAGVVLEYDPESRQLRIDVRNLLRAGDDVELLLPREVAPVDTGHLTGEQGKALQRVHAGSRIFLPFDRPVPPGALLRKKITPQ